MTNNENILVVAMEECSEIAKAISKFIRFGAKGSLYNEHDIWEEYYQLRAVLDLAQELGILHDIPDSEAQTIMAAKQLNVMKYAKLSEEFGIIQKRTEKQI